MSVRLTVEHSYSKKMLESGDNQIKKKRTCDKCAFLDSTTPIPHLRVPFLYGPGSVVFFFLRIKTNKASNTGKTLIRQVGITGMAILSKCRPQAKQGVAHARPADGYGAVPRGGGTPSGVGGNGSGDMAAGYRRAQARHNGV
jgi:hypothetical protein